MNGFRWSVRVYLEDTDAGGIVFYANYLKFMERARSEWLQAHLGFQLGLLQEHHLQFVVQSLQIDYHRPSRLGDRLDVGVHVVEQRRASLSLRQDMWRGEDAICTAQVRLACLDAQTLRPKAFPDFLLALGQQEPHSL